MKDLPDAHQRAGTMLFGSPKTILLISPQPWDGLKVSKHHYAEALADLGHRVYFVEPPSAKLALGGIQLRPADVFGVQVVTYGAWFPCRVLLKFKVRGLFNLLMRWQAHLILSAIRCVPDLVWDFDNAYQFSDLRVFGAQRSILQLVDQLPAGNWTDKHANHLVSVAPSILARIQDTLLSKHMIDHCVGKQFGALAAKIIDGTANTRNIQRLKVGYFGNLAQVAIDWKTINVCVDEHKEIDFEFMGPLPKAGEVSTAHMQQIAVLQSAKNCSFVGRLSPAEIASRANAIDIWLLCYDLSADYNDGANSHKILEYLATGSVCVSSCIQRYKDSPLMVMTSQRSNENFPQMFSNVVEGIERFNSTGTRRLRANYALTHSYSAALKKIDKILVCDIVSASR
jgi:hypothetical protein